MTVVVALGGNALAPRGSALDVTVQRANAERAARAIAAVARHGPVVVTHGNGPQVGLLALQSEAYREVAPYPLDVLDAESEGMVGYLLAQALGRATAPDRVATLLTQVVVDAGDPAFRHPTKPIGPMLEPAAAARAASERGWTVAPDGEGMRRVVPSPEPRAVVELGVVRTLVTAGVLVVCVGGGGIPVVADPEGGYAGVEAVIDKDLASGLLAAGLGADALLLLTDVDAVHCDFGTPRAAPIAKAGAHELRALGLPAGSMGPKVEAACRFADGGGVAVIGSLDDAEAMLAGTAGTTVVAGSHPLTLSR